MTASAHALRNQRYLILARERASGEIVIYPASGLHSLRIAAAIATRLDDNFYSEVRVADTKKGDQYEIQFGREHAFVEWKGQRLALPVEHFA